MQEKTKRASATWPTAGGQVCGHRYAVVSMFEQRVLARRLDDRGFQFSRRSLTLYMKCQGVTRCYGNPQGKVGDGATPACHVGMHRLVLLHVCSVSRLPIALL